MFFLSFNGCLRICFVGGTRLYRAYSVRMSAVHITTFVVLMFLEFQDDGKGAVTRSVAVEQAFAGHLACAGGTKTTVGASCLHPACWIFKRSGREGGGRPAILFESLLPSILSNWNKCLPQGATCLGQTHAHDAFSGFLLPPLPGCSQRTHTALLGTS